jgi:NAD(P)-dependent dehydrogenase (short-subunit alcohol dehydrogenase family)
VGRLEGCRVLVIGASGGLGRGIALGLAAEDARLVVASRRFGLLEQLRDETDGQAHPIACDVTDPDSCQAVVDAAVAELGGLDGLVYAPGIAAVTKLWKADVSHWHKVFDTNVIGAGLITAAAVPYLEASEGLAVYLSSVSAHLNPPWIGMGLYLSSKIALEKCVEVWKLEHPMVRFTTMIIGSTSGNDFFDHADKPDPAALEAFAQEWSTRGYLAAQQLTPSDQADEVIHLLSSRAQTVVWVRHRTQLQLRAIPEE